MTSSTASTEVQLRISQNAGKSHPWPDFMDAPDKLTTSVFLANQTNREFDDWLPGDIIELSRLSQQQAEAIRQWKNLQSEGHILLGGKSGLTRIENPRSRVVSGLNATISASLRRLGFAAGAATDKRSGASRAAASRAAAAFSGSSKVFDQNLPMTDEELMDGSVGRVSDADLMN